MSRKNFCQSVKYCVILCHGSGLLAKGGCREFPFSKKSVPNQLYSHIFVGQQWVKTFAEEYLGFLNAYGIEYDERYIFND